MRDRKKFQSLGFSQDHVLACLFVISEIITAQESSVALQYTKLKR